MRKKFISYYIIIIVVVFSISAVFASVLARKYYRQETEQKIVSVLSLIKNSILNRTTEDIKAFDVIAHNFSEQLNGHEGVNNGNSGWRVSFFNSDGEIIADSAQEDLESKEDRTEVLNAVQGIESTDTRKLSGYNVMYRAVPLAEKNIILRISVPLVQIKNIDRIIIIYTGVSMLSGLLLSLILTAGFTMTITKPVNQLINISREIAKGNYFKRVRINDKYEFGELADTFNCMADRLENTIQDLINRNIEFDLVLNSMGDALIAVDRDMNVIIVNEIACRIFDIDSGKRITGLNIIEIIRDRNINMLITETIKNNVSLTNEFTFSRKERKVLRVFTAPIRTRRSKEANAGGIIFIQDITKIKKLEEIRTDFVANVTHELKTPLTSIRGFIETLKNGAINDREVSERFLEIIDIEAERLYMIINDILTLSEIESRQGDINIKTFHIRPLVEEVVSLLKDLSKKNNISFNISIDSNLRMAANRDRIKQMFINLLDNAIKYNRKNGKIEITAFRDEGRVIIKIRDTGIGIPEANLSRIFERFYRVDKGRSRSMGGTGLGLSIVKHIVNLYSGTVDVRSEYGTGTEFAVQFPVQTENVNELLNSK